MRSARRLGLQARLVSWVLLLVTMFLAATLLASQALLRDRLSDRIAQELRGEVAELRLLADEGLDPESGRPFAAAPALLALHLRRSIPDPGEVYLVLVDGRVAARSDDVPPVRLDRDEAFLELARSATATEYGRYESAGGNVRYAIAPVTAGATGPGGTYVVAIFDEAEVRAIRTAGAVTLGVAGLLLVPAATVSWVLAGRALAPLRHMRTTARRISQADLRGRIQPRHRPTSLLWDELDDLAVTFNAMLDRLADAFQAQRHFVDVAGHELRTPLTVIRGHLELLDEEDDPAARSATRQLLDDELARMGRLVADLQTLTKSTQPSFLNRTSVDAAVLTEEALARSRGLGERTWLLAETAHVHLQADRHRVVQALLQLAANAVAHTAPGDTIALASRVVGDEVHFRVTDNGPGVRGEIAGRVFDRFVHGEDSHGAGLGLSIVEAIARAHRGRAELQSTGPDGATFAIVLPRPPHDRDDQG